LLLDAGADATNALPSAVWGSHFALAESALAHGGDLDRATSNGKPLLNDLIRWGQVEPALWVLAHGASTATLDADGWTPLHQAVSRGNARVVQALLAAGADPDAADLQGRTPAGLSRAANRAKIRPLLLAARSQSRGNEPDESASKKPTRARTKRSTKKAKR
jgi:ankyrin repeat protein